MRSNPDRRNPDFWCEFHNDHGHKTADCRLLEGEVEHLQKQGYLTDLFSAKDKQSYMKNRQEPPKPPSPKRTVNVISGGEEVNDADGLIIPHNDPLVISLLIHDSNVKRVLIDPGSSMNIILLRMVNEMRMGDKIVPKERSLFGFDNSTVITKGNIVLTTFVERVIKDTKFQVIDTDMDYNMILGRSWIHDIDIVPYTLYQVIKFPSQRGIRQIRGDQ
ncbi:uncharacterized protein LOC107807762 [Nicotiana tabacum]|uniref:Uncharacterized protein LOC107807762 n=1 Tax=Nicotiana tabacum TaxID=4097 RepID=A0AC58S6Y6_TOBAC